MTAWPNIQKPSYDLSEKPEDAVIRTQFEAGYEITRPRFTRNRATFGLSWNSMRAADKATLATFYTTTTVNGSLSFTWTHPDDGTTHTVRFTEPPQYTLIAVGLYRVSVTLREV